MLTEPGADWEEISTLNECKPVLPKVNTNYTSFSLAFFVPYILLWFLALAVASDSVFCDLYEMSTLKQKIVILFVRSDPF